MESKTLHDHKNDFSEVTTTHTENMTGRSSDSTDGNDVANDLQRTPTHANRALQLVNKATGADTGRRPSKGGILSQLLKLNVFENDLSASSSRVDHRPSHQIRSITSSKAFFQMMGASRSSPDSYYMEDMNRTEMGIPHGEDAVTAHRMAIATEIADILQRQEIVIKMGKSLVQTGAPSHRIEAAMDKVSKRLEIEGSYAVVPGLIIVTFGDAETHTSDTHLVRCSRSLDIGKLERANFIAGRIAKGEVSLDEATVLLDDIIDGPPTWHPASIIVGYIFSSAFTAPLFFKGSWTDCWVSALFGLAVGVLTYVAEKIPMFNNVFEITMTIPLAVVSLALHKYICFTAVAMASIVIALPGYSLTCSVMELSAKNLVSGSIHLVYALMYAMFLAFGIGYGCSIWRLVHPDIEISALDACQNDLSPYWTFLFLPLATIGLGTVYGADVYQWPSMVLDSAVGYAVYYFVGQYVNSSSVIQPSAGAFALGLFGNIYARLTKRLAFVPLMGGTIILVPGSVGVRGAVSLFDGSNVDGGTSFVFQMLSIALSLTFGLFLANLIVFPQGKKKSVFLGF